MISKDEISPQDTMPGIVVLGAAEGGRDVLVQLFGVIPADLQLAFVVFCHAGAAEDLAPVLARHTQMPVQEFSNGVLLRAGTLTIAPSTEAIRLEGVTLVADAQNDAGQGRLPLDYFLQSVAAEAAERSAVVILSGNGSDGALGVREFRAAGGLAIVQDPLQAECSGMVRSALTDGVDLVLRVENMPEIFATFSKTGGRMLAEASRGDSPDEAMSGIVGLIHSRTGHDFRCYKSNTLLRRAQRRAGFLKFDSLQDYLEHLRQNGDELEALVRDFRIGVTSFFREPLAWQALKESVLQPLVAEAALDQYLRLWVAACATGEEAYTLAILVAEALGEQGREVPIQIYATDANAESINFARAGVYPESIAATMSPERLQRFFTREGNFYRVRRRIREMVIFAAHNLISDPPFSRLDLITCRNLLIYLEPEMQRRLIQLFQFGLREGGFLFLGSSETIGRESDVFTVISKRWRLFRRTGLRRKETILRPDANQHAQRDKADATLWRSQNLLVDSTRKYLIERFAPAAVLVNERLDALVFSGNTSPFLHQPSGERTDSLLEMALEDLRDPLRSLVHRAFARREGVLQTECQIQRISGPVQIQIAATPISIMGEARPFLLLTFRELDGEPRLNFSTQDPEVQSTVQLLEQELRASKEELQSIIEEMDTANEELKAANEEITSINEELQSANEELEASKEELLITNNELQSVNAELKDKVLELQNTSADLRNLLTSTNIAVIFLDTDLAIKRFTPAATRFFRLISGDIGRPLLDIVAKVHDTELEADAKRVLDELTSVEREIQTPEGKTFIRRALPYRTEDFRVAGVVLTFTEITRLRETMRALHHSEKRYRSLVAATSSVVWRCSLAGEFIEQQPDWERHTGQRWEEYRGLGWLTAMHPDDRDAVAERWAHAVANHTVYYAEGRLWSAAAASYRHVVSRGAPVQEEDGTVTEWIGTITDVHEQKLAQQEINRLAAVVEHSCDAVFTKDFDGTVLSWNKAAEELYGYTAKEFVGGNIRRAVPPDKMEEVENIFERLRNGERVERAETVRIRKDGSRVNVSLTISPVLDEDGTVQCLSVIARDISERKRFEARIVALNEELQRRLYEWDAVWTTAPVGLVICNDTSCDVIRANEAASRILGAFSPDNVSLNLAKNRSLYRIYREGEEIAPQDLPLQRAARIGEASRDVELEVRRADGSSVFILISASPMCTADGEVFGAVAGFMDITHRKCLESELRSLNLELEDRVEQRTETVRQQVEQLRALSMQLAQAEQRERRRLAEVLHDHLQQLLVGAKLHIGRLKNASTLDPETVATVEELLDESIEASRSLAMELSPPILYQQGFTPALQWLARRMEQRHGLAVELNVETSGGIALNEEEQSFLFGAIRELLFNVIKHANTDRAWVGVALEDEGETLLVEVLDRGKGFPDEIGGAESSFGLQHLRERVNAFWGSLAFESVPEGGAAVQIRLPNGRGTVAEEAVEGNGNSRQRPRPDESTVCRILLVDDHQIVREGLRGLLEADHEFRVIGEASDGEEAIWLAHALLPDVVVMDVSMPRMNGIEATRRLRDELPDIQVVALTLHEEPEVASAMQRAGAIALVNKAAPHEELCEAIRTAAGQNCGD